MRNLFKRLNCSKFLLLLTGLVLPLLILQMGCGNSENQQSAAKTDRGTEATAQAGRGTDPCTLTKPGVVAEVFGGAVVDERPGIARNCTYDIEAGSVRQVNVYYYGTATEWDGIRTGYEDNRGPLTDVPGVGDKAFYPGDVGENEIVVLSGNVAFAVGLGSEPAQTGAAGKVKQFAVRIAQDVI